MYASVEVYGVSIAVWTGKMEQTNYDQKYKINTTRSNTYTRPYSSVKIQSEIKFETTCYHWGLYF